MNTLKAEKRNMKTKAKKLRREGFVTGNVFGKEIKDSMPIQIARADAERFLKANGKGSKVTLELDGQAIDTLIKDVSYNALKRQFMEVDFQALVKGEKVNSVAEVVLLGQDMVSTGVLEKQLNEISYRATPDALVEKIEIDVSGLRAGDSILVKNLAIASNKNVEVLTDLDAIVVTVSEVYSQVEETENEEGADQ